MWDEKVYVSELPAKTHQRLLREHTETFLAARFLRLEEDFCILFRVSYMRYWRLSATCRMTMTMMKGGARSILTM